MKSRLDQITDWEDRVRLADYRVKKLAELCGSTTRQLERYFGEKFRIAPHVWMDQLRLRDVEARLASGELAKNLTEEVGFSHAAYFSYWCKRHSGHGLGDLIRTLVKG